MVGEKVWQHYIDLLLFIICIIIRNHSGLTKNKERRITLHGIQCQVYNVIDIELNLDEDEG